MENKNDSQNPLDLDEQLKIWQEVYAIEEGMEVDLDPTGTIKCEGYDILPVDDRNTRKPKSNTTSKSSNPEDILDMNLREVKELAKPNHLHDKIDQLRTTSSSETTNLKPR